jgi:hypothetical protein
MYACVCAFAHRNDVQYTAAQYNGKKASKQLSVRVSGD